MSADPKQALLDSTREIGKENFRFTMISGPARVEANIHPESQSARLNIEAGTEEEGEEFSISLEFIVTESDSWVRMGISGLEDLPGADRADLEKYQHLDRSRIKNDEDLQFSFDDVDPAGSEDLARAIVDVQKTGEGAYRGTIDLTKAPDSDVADEEMIKELGAAASNIPFTATLDGQGRLTALTFELPAVGETAAQEIKIVYEYGAGTPVQPPPADQVIEATDEMYEMLSS